MSEAKKTDVGGSRNLTALDKTVLEREITKVESVFGLTPKSSVAGT